MNKLAQETADREINRAIVADEQANAHYYQILRRFISSHSITSDGKLRQPEAKLNADGLKEIEKAWLLLQITAKKLRRSYMKLYTSSLY
ncbi:MAG: hypothetical protein ACYSWW_28660 [Planctomycetota bacterium]|jgi:hypothetical protein